MKIAESPPHLESRLGNAGPGTESNLDQGAMMSPQSTALAKFSSVFLRFALGISFLSAVADRFGIWGAYGQPNVSWGDYARFVAYTAKLNWFLPPATIPTLAMIATAAETILGLLLVLGWKTRIAALLSGLLLISFALTMTLALGVKAPLNLSVFSAAGGALLLGACEKFPLSLDELLQRNRQRK
jgi:uncharacterized membrane protein YphA (DoxX/SURF4 family)